MKNNPLERKRKPPALSRRSVITGAVAATLAGGIGTVTYQKLFSYSEGEEEFLNRFIKLQTQDEFTRKTNKGNERKARNLDESFSAEEIDDIIWNIYNEARQKLKMEPREGQLAVLLCVIDRMAHRNNPSTATGVIYKPGQFSWVGKKFFPIYRQNISPARQKILEKYIRASGGQNLLEIRKMIIDLTKGKTIKEVRAEIVRQIESTGIRIPPTPILFYKRTDWDHKDPNNPNYKKMSARSREHWTNVELKMQQRNEQPFTIGVHTFYSATNF